MRRLQGIGQRCGLEDEGHDAGGDHGRTDDAGLARTGATGSFKPPPSFANVDDSTSERRLERRLGGAPSLERGGAMAKSRPVVASRPADDQPGRLGGDHRVDSGEFGESAQRTAGIIGSTPVSSENRRSRLATVLRWQNSSAALAPMLPEARY